VLAGIGAWRLAETFIQERAGRRRRSHGYRGRRAGLQFLWYLPLVRTVGEEAGAPAPMSRSPGAARELPRNAIVLTQNPNMFHVWGYNAAQASLASTRPVSGECAGTRYAGGIFFHWNFWCNVADPVQQAFCTATLARFRIR
jgi:hypothetical protein